MTQAPLDALLDALEEHEDAKRGGAQPERLREARERIGAALDALIDARVAATLRAWGVAARVGAEDEERRVEGGNDD
jgi:hypothetical protein